jgi:hypothetical protein
MRKKVEIAIQWLYATKTGPDARNVITVGNTALPLMILANLIYVGTRDIKSME